MFSKKLTVLAHTTLEFAFAKLNLLKLCAVLCSVYFRVICTSTWIFYLGSSDNGLEQVHAQDDDDFLLRCIEREVNCK